MTDHDQIASEVFGIRGLSAPLPGEFDENAKIVDRDGRAHLLRITRRDRDRGRIAFLQSVVAVAADVGVATPSMRPTVDGALSAVIEDGRIAHCYTWVDGVSFANAGRPADLAFSIGVTAGELVNALTAVPPGRVDPDFVWDLTDAGRVVGQRMGAVGDSHRRRLIEMVMDRYSRIELETLPRQVIHNDLNDENILVGDGTVVGVIDFGDATETIRVAELAIACAYVMLDQDDPVTVATDAVAGYRSVAALDEAEADALLDLILIRLATSVAVSAARGEANPHHMLTDALAWDILERLAAGDLDRVAAEIAAAGTENTIPVVADDLLDRRSVLGPSLSLSYEEPLTIVRGAGQYLFDERGRRYLDCVNNVCHVGHANRAVADAATNQMLLLYTNIRYLHGEIIRYAERILATLPDRLDRVFLVNSGSEANDLAIRLVRVATGRTDVACVDHGYHGHTSTLIDVSPYKFNSAGGQGQRLWVRVLPSLDPYRHEELQGLDAGVRYRERADEALGDASPAGLIIEALPGCGGQVMPAAGVPNAAYQAVRDRGGLVIADEVQTGFGRTGRFWAFEWYGLEPDVVTMGKPAGNGHPLAVVATTSEIADAFDNGMEYFNTFGGNPVSAAVGNAVLDEIERLDLIDRGSEVGAYLLDGLHRLATRHPAIGDVRGAGLFLGVELVEHRDTKRPAAKLAHGVIEHAKRDGVLLSTDGPFENVIKIKPPMVFDQANAGRLIQTIDEALTALG
jgi:4-aminobutyrate aminotransferase-like enzyme/Ser/Thr protein kinase RdoA (MazF antagonist)